MKTQNIQIKGMHCRSCEILIEDELTKIKGVKKVDVNHKTGIATVVCHEPLNNKEVEKAVNNAGYTLGVDEKTTVISRNKNDYKELGVAFLIVTILFFAAKSFGIFDLGNSITGSYSSLPIVLLIGLTAGVSTCMALVGGLVLGASAKFSAQNPNASGMEKFRPHLFFNIGRIASYFVLGGVVGLAGSFFQMSTSVLGYLTVAVGLVMLILGGQLIDIFPILKKFSFTLPKSVSRTLGIQNVSTQYSDKNASIMGALTFFLPCGFTQAMQLYAMSTGSIVAGALTMGVFAIGTAPGLLGVGGLTSVVKGQTSKLFFKSAGIVVIILALFNMSNGLNLLGIGINPQVLGYSDTKNTADDTNVVTGSGVQEVRMTQDWTGYSPNKFTVKKGVPVRWIINSKNAYTCSSSIVSQQLGIRQALQAGENIIEFTPKETGNIRFTCSMGMYSGNFNVVENDATTSNSGVTGGQMSVLPLPTAKPTTAPAQAGNVQVLKSTYTYRNDISPNTFKVKVNQPVRLEINAQDDGQGCMGSIAIPNLSRKVDMLTRGQTTVFEFTPTKTGNFPITCAMGVPRGQIQVV